MNPRAPVLVLQNLSSDGPAYLGRWLRDHHVAHRVLDTEAGDAYPQHIDGYGALALLGGAMSANDELPSLRQAEALILQAMARGIPVIGHCLGGQLMARALGASVTRSPAPEIGWQPLQVRNTPQAHEWFGAEASHTVMQWHYEAFGLPGGAQWLASSAACPHQAFSVGPHLAMQFHLEIDEAKLLSWVAEESVTWREAQAAHRSVQNATEILARRALHVGAHQRLADRIYRRWLAPTGLLDRVVVTM
ncbi:MAG TPA: type 1 glutamine amidotransferase [Rubrivivax sp.]